MARRLPSAPPILPGLSYIRPLGSGGFADVFLYEQDMPRRAVAVKVLPGDVRDGELRRMFNAEADVLARLSAHPSIVTVYQAGVSADGRPYIVMEYCPGSLAPRYRHERIAVTEALSIGIRMAAALETAHQAGVLHRDVKPSNILITTFGAPVLADFGISSSLIHARTGELLAMSVPWSAPEVLAEHSQGSLASEEWSLGATVYSLMAGHSPFERRDRSGNDREQLRRRIEKASFVAIARPDVPPLLQQVLATSMSKHPADRYGSARAFAEALQTVQTDMGLTPTTIDVPTDDWAETPRPVDFDDDTLRGLSRATVGRQGRRALATLPRARGATADEDETSFSPPPSPRHRRAIWVLVACAALVAGVVVAIVLTGSR